MTSKVAIIILNWNGWEDTIECLESVYQIIYPLYEVIVVDNGSKDESIEKINNYAEGSIRVESKFFDFTSENKPIYVKEYSKDELKPSISMKETAANAIPGKNLILIKNDNNYGFAEGNNIGIRYALNNLDPDYVLLLNNDAVVDPNFLNELVNKAENDPQIGILGPTVYEYKSPQEIQSAGAKIYWNKGEAVNLTSRENKYSDEPEDVDSVIGCALLAKSELFYKIGCLNKDYFAYLEETEWCVRAHKEGYRIVHVPKGMVWHKGGATSNKLTGFTLYHYTRNRFWFMRTHASKKQYFFCLAYFFGFRLWMVIGGILYRQKSKDILPSFISFFKGIRDGIMT
jgi:GT2 family glycosyltransferase